MLRYAVLRLIQAPLVLFVLVTISFFLMRFAEGGPFLRERSMDPVAQAQLEARYRLDQPLHRQYLGFLGDLARGDLGESFQHPGESVNERIARFLPTSLLLGSLALALALGLGLAAGTIAAIRRNRWQDHAGMAAAMVGLALPPFVVGPFLALALGLWWGLLPVSGYEGWASPRHLILPAVTLALPFAARIARLSRAGILEVLAADHVRTARAKGLGEWAVLCRHVLRGGLQPVVAYLGPAAASLLTGSLVVEQIFGIPGVGVDFVEAAFNRDYTVVMGTVLVYGVLLILFNLASDLIQAAWDPRVRSRV